ncbi:hypothetical protein LVY65_05085 [Sphingomonas sp. G124]|uniref:HNH endonuclease n=1 Tax=Sphingomonas cremea TaxID=2904799 RepID=A0A9X1QJA4_9SPHN|nr:hypothetical protein [Sphingomonas cremea]MCF2514440.1 hypothetical protein [Sphingomonas cremea]
MENPRAEEGARASKLAGSSKISTPKPTGSQPPKLSPQAKWKAANPKAVWAHVALKSALRRGLIERQPCAVCGTTRHVDGHHPDYDQPMAVVWLCRAHHVAVHRQRGRDG